MSSDPIHPWYVTGFLEGSGCFTFSRNGSTLALYLAVKASASDRETLEQVRAFFGGAGSIYDVRDTASPPDGGEGGRGVLYYRVTRLSDLRAVIGHLDRFPLRGAKASAYQIWREMFDLKSTQLRRTTVLRLDELAGRLSKLSRRRRTAGGSPGLTPANA